MSLDAANSNSKKNRQTVARPDQMEIKKISRWHKQYLQGLLSFAMQRKDCFLDHYVLCKSIYDYDLQQLFQSSCQRPNYLFKFEISFSPESYE